MIARDESGEADTTGRTVQARLSPDGFVAQRVGHGENGSGRWVLATLDLDGGVYVRACSDDEVSDWPHLGIAERRIAWSPAEVAQATGLHVRKVYADIQIGKLKAVRLGKHLRITDEAMREYASGDAVDPAEHEPAAASYTVPEVAELAGVPKMRVYADIKSGALSADRVGRKFVVRQDAVQRYFELPKSA
jgi:excisionase family DNA binding protein